jgi:protein SCO1/2
VGVFVTLDPERDTPERLQLYLGGFDKTFYGLTGTAEQLEQVKKAYGVTAIKRELPESAIKYTIDHSTFIYTIDKTGKLRVLFPHGSTVDDMLSDVRYLLRES